jgi:hypothetical protein
MGPYFDIALMTVWMTAAMFMVLASYLLLRR